MANVHISLAGEGRGHAARARTLIDSLRAHHRITVHTFGDAYDFLQPLYARTERFAPMRGAIEGVAVKRIPGLQFRYGPGGQLDYLRSTVAAARSLPSLAKTTRELASRLEADGADLVITDFEPTLPRAARLAGLPVIGLDHQSAFTHGDFGELPGPLRRHARLIGAVVRAWTPRPDLQISSSFYRPRPGRTAARRAGSVHFVGVLLREAVRAAMPTRGDHIVAYLRPGTRPEALEALRASHCEVRLYGVEGVRDGGSLAKRPVSEDGFISDLASCRAVVTTAGNQLLGEAIHLGKPILAMPEPGNREQEINGWFLGESGAGQVISCAQLSKEVLRSFLANERRYQKAGRDLDVDGTGRALELIEAAIHARQATSGRAPLRRRGRNRAASIPATA